jgi:hypothetical protein
MSRHRQLAICLAAVLLIVVIAPAHAQDITAQLNLSSQQPATGDQIQVEVVVDLSQVSYKLGAYAASLTWDTGVLELAETADGETAEFQPPQTKMNVGELLFSGFNAVGAAGSLSLIKVKFNAIGLAGQSATLGLSFTTLDAAATFTSLLPQLQVQVSPAVTVAGYGQPTQEAKLTASDGTAGDNFGHLVSLSGDRLAVTAIRDDDHGTDSGAAYVFSWDGNAWVEQTKLTASDGAAGDNFGYGVSLSGDRLAVAAAFDDDYGDQSGAAYVFSWDGSAWVEQAKLTPSDATTEDIFGSSVSLSGDRLVVGARQFNSDFPTRPGAAYVFDWDGSAWVEQAKLTASDGAAGDVFGYTVSLSGDRLVVGAHGNDGQGSDSGAAYVFDWDGSAWVEQAKLTASDGVAEDVFGNSVSLSGDRLAVSAWGNDDYGGDSGSVYMFGWDGSAWVEQAKLVASDGAAGDRFGQSVSLSGDQVVIGAFFDDDRGSNSGSAYVFNWDGSAWVEQTKLTASDGAGGDMLGIGVSLSGDRLVASAWEDDDNGSNSGSAYVFSLPSPVPPLAPVAMQLAVAIGQDSVLANGIGESAFTVTALDADGNVVSSDNSTVVQLNVDGPAELVGDSQVTLTAGSFSGTLRSTAISGQVTLTASAEGLTTGVDSLLAIGIPQIVLSATALDFGIVPVGSSVPEEVSIRNAGNGVLEIGEVTVDAEEFSVELATQSLAPGDSAIAVVTFAPQAAEGKSGVLRLFSNNPQMAIAEITLSGQGQASLLVVVRIGSARRPSPYRARVGRTLRFEVSTFATPDTSDLQVVEDYTWEVPPELGTQASLGELDLTTVAGVMDTILFHAQGLTVPFILVTKRHSITRVEIDPPELVVEPGGKQTFRAYAYDRYDNKVLGQKFGWHLVGGIGEIDRYTGRFTAGENPGEGYVIAVVNTALVFSDAGADVEETDSGTGKVVVRRSLPGQFSLLPNFPNPFNPSTGLRFGLPVESQVRLSIFNLAGQEVERLVEGYHPAGFHQVMWNAEGRPSGVYFSRLEAGSFVATRKMLLTK